MRLASMLLIAVTASLPFAAGAVDVNLGAIVEGVYDSNIYRTAEDQRDDGSFRFTPTIEIEVPGKKFSGDVYYAPTYEVFTTYSDANDLTHDVRNNLSWMPSEKTNLSLYNRFRAVDVLNFGDPDGVDDAEAQIPDNEIKRSRLYLFGSSLTIGHTISPRWNSTTNVNFDLFESERRFNVDSKSIGAFQSVDYGMTASDRVGGGAGVTVQLFDEVPGLPASNTYVYQLFASYVRSFGERTTVTLRLGPALVHTVQDSLDATAAIGIDEGGLPAYPHSLIPELTTVEDVSSVVNDDIRDVDGNILPGSTAISAGSVLVPDPANCSSSDRFPSVKDLLDDPGCRMNRLLRNDAAFPDEAGAITTIVDPNSTVTLTGSNSGSNDLRWTIFGEVAVTHLWLPTLASTLSYNRREATANGQGASTIADSVQFRTTWQPSELWDLSLRANYTRRESPTNLSSSFAQIELDSGLASFPVVRLNGGTSVVEVSNAVATHRWGVTLRAARRMTRRITASFRLGYTDQRSRHTTRNPNDFGNFLAIVGVKYDFDPFRF